MNWYRTSQLEGQEPWDMTEDEFISYHKTGGLDSETYDSYREAEGMTWIKKENYPLLYSTVRFRDKSIEFKMTGDPVRYTKRDEDGDGEIVRDESGLATYLSNEEMVAKELPLVDTAIGAFDGDVAIGLASNEFGTDGIWVIESHQGIGIGTYLLKEFRKQFKSSRKIGQMTNAGENMARSYYRDIVKEHYGLV